MSPTPVWEPRLTPVPQPSPVSLHFLRVLTPSTLPFTHSPPPLPHIPSVLLPLNLVTNIGQAQWLVSALLARCFRENSPNGMSFSSTAHVSV